MGARFWSPIPQPCELGMTSSGYPFRTCNAPCRIGNRQRERKKKKKTSRTVFSWAHSLQGLQVLCKASWALSFFLTSRSFIVHYKYFILCSSSSACLCLIFHDHALLKFLFSFPFTFFKFFHPLLVFSPFTLEFLLFRYKFLYLIHFLIIPSPSLPQISSLYLWTENLRIHPSQ